MTFSPLLRLSIAVLRIPKLLYEWLFYTLTLPFDSSRYTKVDETVSLKVTVNIVADHKPIFL
ncbi:hypothetical protein SAMN05428952_10855 [Nitrosomonas sp. Nm132]|nr:hypothetical protein SAMN05428952_10855 [Nitrosomonas sp. Nm132]